jgi:hypothetical protein
MAALPHEHCFWYPLHVSCTNFLTNSCFVILDKNIGWSWQKWMDIPTPVCSVSYGHHWTYATYFDCKASSWFCWLHICNFIAH